MNSSKRFLLFLAFLVCWPFHINSSPVALAQEPQPQEDIYFHFKVHVNCATILQVNRDLEGGILQLNGYTLPAVPGSKEVRAKYACGTEDAAFQHQLDGDLKLAFSVPAHMVNIGRNTLTARIKVDSVIPPRADHSGQARVCSEGLFISFKTDMLIARYPSSASSWRSLALGTDFFGCIPLDSTHQADEFFTLEELAPGLATEIQKLRDSLPGEMLATAEANAKRDAFSESFAATKDALSALLEKDIDAITDADLELLRNTAQRNTVADAKKKLAELRAQAQELVEKIKADARNLANEIQREQSEWGGFVEGVAKNLPQMRQVDTNDEGDARIDLQNNPYKTFADAILEDLEAAGQKFDRSAFLAIAAHWNSQIRIKTAELEGRPLLLVGEGAEFMAQARRVEEYIKGRLSSTAFYEKFPDSEQVRATVTDDLAAYSPEHSRSLTMALGGWSQNLKPEQRRLAHAILLLGQFAKDSGEQALLQTEQFKKAIAESVNAAYQLAAGLGQCFVIMKKAGLLGDVYEVVAGKDLCSGENLSVTERVVTAAAAAASFDNGELINIVFRKISARSLGKANDVVSSGLDLARLEKLGALAKKFGFKTKAEIKQHVDLLERLHTGFKFKKLEEAADVNARMVQRGMEPGYKMGTKAVEVETTGTETWLRVHGEGNQARPWLLNEADIQGLSAQQIAQKYNIPNVPTKVRVPQFHRALL